MHQHFGIGFAGAAQGCAGFQSKETLTAIRQISRCDLGGVPTLMAILDLFNINSQRIRFKAIAWSFPLISAGEGCLFEPLSEAINNCLV